MTETFSYRQLQNLVINAGRESRTLAFLKILTLILRGKFHRSGLHCARFVRLLFKLGCDYYNRLHSLLVHFFYQKNRLCA